MGDESNQECIVGQAEMGSCGGSVLGGEGVNVNAIRYVLDVGVGEK